jgi:hypothetical protein
MNRLLECDNMVNSPGTPGLIPNAKTSYPAATATSPDGHRSTSHSWEHESGIVNPTHVLANGMSQPKILSHAADSSLDSRRGVPPSSQIDGGHSSQGRLPKLSFPVFSGEDPQLWRSCCKNYFEINSMEPSF